MTDRRNRTRARGQLAAVLLVLVGGASISCRKPQQDEPPPTAAPQARPAAQRPGEEHTPPSLRSRPPEATTRAAPSTQEAAATQAARTRPAEPTTRPQTAYRPPATTPYRQAERDAMVRTIKAYGLTDEAVLRVMAAVPRHEFVPARYSAQAYADTPLPIGYGQTISQPYIVAEMTRLLELRSDSRVLEIGTGSGYQAAVLAHLTPHVCTIEIIDPLAESAGKRLRRVGYTAVTVRQGDGYYGWGRDARFDGIIVTCAAARVPPALIRQLAPGGRMVIPVGGPYSRQFLTLVEKDAAGKVTSRRLTEVRFVPLRRRDISGG
jgi:protein-L-isoaspartate(D-aspartate) O-methyltransferase